PRVAPATTAIFPLKGRLSWDMAELLHSRFARMRRLALLRLRSRYAATQSLLVPLEGIGEDVIADSESKLSRVLVGSPEVNARPDSCADELIQGGRKIAKRTLQTRKSGGCRVGRHVYGRVRAEEIDENRYTRGADAYQSRRIVRI